MNLPMINLLDSHPIFGIIYGEQEWIYDFTRNVSVEFLINFVSHKFNKIIIFDNSANLKFEGDIKNKINVYSYDHSLATIDTIIAKRQEE